MAYFNATAVHSNTLFSVHYLITIVSLILYITYQIMILACSMVFLNLAKHVSRFPIDNAQCTFLCTSTDWYVQTHVF